jgi:hypothetical protein
MKESTKQDQRPAFQFYPDDWVSETGLRLSSLESKGLWIELICIMFRAEKRGLLQLNGSKISSKQLAKMLGEDEEKIISCLKELKDNEVLETLDDGTIYCRRMYREWSLKQKRKEAGSKGGKQKASKNKSKKASKSKQMDEEGVEVEVEIEVENKLMERFNIFWKAYPKKKSKGQAEKTWKKIKPKQEILGIMLNKIKEGNNSKEWAKDKGEFIPHPSTWLNNKGWEDEYTPLIIGDNDVSDKTRQNMENLEGWEDEDVKQENI